MPGVDARMHIYKEVRRKTPRLYAVLTTINTGTGAGKLETGTARMVWTLHGPYRSDSLTIDMDSDMNTAASATGGIQHA